MAKELKPVDVANHPELLRLAEEVRATREPRLLRRESEDLAIVTPIRPARQRASRARVLTKDDSLFKIVGIAALSKDEPTDVSTNKHKYLADAYANNR